MFESSLYDLYFDDGTSIVALPVAVYNAAKQDYIALMEVDENEKLIPDSNVYIYRLTEVHGEFRFDYIENYAELFIADRLFRHICALRAEGRSDSSGDFNFLKEFLDEYPDGLEDYMEAIDWIRSPLPTGLNIDDPVAYAFAELERKSR